MFRDQDDVILKAKPPPPAPKNRNVAQMKFDFDSPVSDTKDEPEQKFNQTQKNYFFGKLKNSTIAEVADEEDED